MVFGIGEGSMDLQLDRTDVKSGGRITGKLKLNLNKPKEAKGLYVRLMGERRVTRRGKKRKETVYNYVQQLGGEKTYESGEYTFELKVPEKTEVEKKMGEGMAGAVVGVAKTLGVLEPVRYYVKANLDVPMSLDISKTVEIAVL
ncbi:hypothetical protein GF318_01645 [Candidatus Micrarchaeota archaeon]|nr:hypothetical protein [Candidatus Micrarchaeota archaeon]